MPKEEGFAMGVIEIAKMMQAKLSRLFRLANAPFGHKKISLDTRK